MQKKIEKCPTWLPDDCVKVKKGPKKCKSIQSWPKSMAFHTKKDLKSKNIMGKKVYVLANDVHTERKFEIKAKKTS